MANWKQKIILRDLIESYDPYKNELEEIARIKPLWVERLKSIHPLRHFSTEMDWIVTERDFNRFLSTIYDYCDNNLIWID